MYKKHAGGEGLCVKTREKARHSLITNYSVLSPEVTRQYIVCGDERFERAKELLEKSRNDFSAIEIQSLGAPSIWRVPQ